MKQRIAAAYCVHDDAWFLHASIESFRKAGPVYVFLSRKPWAGDVGDVAKSKEIALNAGAEVIEGEWTSEAEHRAAALDHLKSKGYTHAFIPDGDEVIEPQLLDQLVKIAELDLADRVYVEWDTYWKSPEYVIRPRERFTPLILLNIERTHHVQLRHFEGGRPLFLTADHGIIHHLSYAGPDERIQKKISSWSHRNEVVPGWYERVWLGWDADKFMRNLHPTHPEAYGFAERVAVPKVLDATARSAKDAGETPALPAASVIIPVHGGSEDLERCLSNLAACKDLIREVIVVDNASPDDSAKIAKKHKVKLIKNKENKGYGAASNQGAAAAIGEVLLFLNSDTVVPRAGLVSLLESLESSGTIGAAGSYSNNVGHHQRIDPTYTSLGTLELFAEDFATRDAEDREVDMLVGFCLAVKRKAWEEVGPFDERFGLGLFEDNDLCYRLRRAGYRLVISSKSFVHHEGSKTLQRLGEFSQRRQDPQSRNAKEGSFTLSGKGPQRGEEEVYVQELFAHNQRLYFEKWRADLECGFASHLAGTSAEPIVFRPENKPEKKLKEIEKLAKKADISLCMIVKNEERVMRDCLTSAKPFFKEMIVVDTGSTDRTVEICKELGAKVYHFPWTDSFSEARNESLRYATGKWIFWMDADDTLPPHCGEALLHAAIHGPKEIGAYVVPVKFTDEGPAAGTMVDHVKLFWNIPGLAFEGHIHEQILPSLRAHDVEVARCGAYVLHSGYDTSPEGQAKKRERDANLLMLDLEERPNHPFVLFNLGMTDHYCHEHETAIEWLTKSIEHSNATDSHVRKAYALKAVSQRELGRIDEAIATLKEGLEAAPDDPELHFHLGLIHTNLEQYEVAKEHYLAVARADISNHFSSVDVGILGVKLFHNIAGVCLAMGDYPEARHWFRRAVQASPTDLLSAFALFDAALDKGDFDTCKSMLEQVREVQGMSESWAKMCEKYSEATGGPANVDAFFSRITMEDPEQPAPRLVYSRRLLGEGRIYAALPHLRHLASRGVAEAHYFLSVHSVREGNFEQALVSMQRALELNPTHEETRKQVQNLRDALGG